jgi:hypothetical protein
MTVLNDLVNEILAAETSDDCMRKIAAFSALSDYVCEVKKEWLQDGYKMGLRHAKATGPLSDHRMVTLCASFGVGLTSHEHGMMVGRAVERAHGIK